MELKTEEKKKVDVRAHVCAALCVFAFLIVIIGQAVNK